jgi:hypothetical protein
MYEDTDVTLCRKEAVTLALLLSRLENWLVCSADGAFEDLAVFLEAGSRFGIWSGRMQAEAIVGDLGLYSRRLREALRTVGG